MLTYKIMLISFFLISITCIELENYIEIFAKKKNCLKNK
jgi:hypothetical protein